MNGQSSEPSGAIRAGDDRAGGITLDERRARIEQGCPWKPIFGFVAQ
jgi:hypothetical protein